MKKFLFLLVGCFSLLSVQQRQYFVFEPTGQMEYVLKSIQNIEQEIQNLGKIIKEIFKKSPDDFLYTPHSFSQGVSWEDLKIALGEIISYLKRIKPLIEEIEYEPYEHPAVAVYRYNRKIWKKEIQELLEDIKKFQQRKVPERARPKRYNYQPLALSSSIYHPSVVHVARRWKAQGPVQPQSRVIAAEQRLSQLD